MEKIINISKGTNQTFHSILSKLVEIIRKGGLKLKLLIFMVLTIILTVTIVSSSTISLMKKSLEDKSLEVATTIIERVSESSIHALLERTYENELNLSEMIKGVQKSNKEGLADITIFARTKVNNKFEFEYLASFQNLNKGKLLKDESLLAKIENADLNKISHHNSTINYNGESIETYQFIKPITYMFKKKKIFLGVATLDYDKSAISKIITKVMWVAISITFSIVLIAMVLLYFTVRRLTKPILSIADAATKVSKGDLDVELNIKTKDEVEILANEFNTMVKGLRENIKMQKFVSGSTLDMIQDNDKTKQLELGGEYKTMTLLFSDIRNFTTMTEHKKPDEVIEIVNFYLNIQSKIIKKHGGDIDKFIGDEVMGSFYGENSVEKALNAAVDIQKTIEKENKTRQAKGLMKCNVGIGIHHGEVVMGNIGSNERMDYTAIGHTVNLASRLCSNAKAGEVLISQNSIDLTENKIRSKKIDPIKVKGISQEIEVHSIIVLKKDF